MIKRQFFALEHHTQGEASSDSSSSSSDSFEASLSDVDRAGAQSDDEASSPAKSGWDVEKDEIENLSKGRADFVTEEYVVMCKNVLKCRLCTKTICLTGDTMRAHLSSKKHARALKHLEEGKLKVMLNSDGEEEEQGETHAERYARTLASAKQERAPVSLKRKSSGRQRQRKRAKRKALLAEKKEGRALDSANHRETDSVTATVEMKRTFFKSKKNTPKISKLTVNKEILNAKPNIQGGFSA